MKFTKEELFDIEEVLDVYAGWISDRLNAYCKTAINYDALHFKHKEVYINPMDSTIEELMRTQKVIKKIRDKLEKRRLKKKVSNTKKKFECDRCETKFNFENEYHACTNCRKILKRSDYK